MVTTASLPVKGEPGGATVEGGRYRILRHVASGGMGEVFLAESVGAHGVSKRVAIKRIIPRADGRGVPLFVEEARTAFALSHASIVQVFDFGLLGQDHVLVMEYVDGVDLARLLEAQPDTRLPLDAALYVAIETLEGLEHAHGRTDTDGNPLHIVHCDIKPSNLLCSRDGEVKIADFGIARAAFHALDARRTPGAGTVGYMAPEQAAGRPVDPRADVYAVAAVLYRALSGHLPEPGLVPAIAAELGTATELDAILAHALARRPEDRTPTASQMLRELEGFAHQEGILASPRALAAIVRGQLEAPAAPARPRRGGLDAVVRARARAIAGSAGTEPFSEGTNIVLARVESGVTEVRIVMPEPLMLPDAVPAVAPASVARSGPALLVTALVLAALAGAVLAGALLWPRSPRPDVADSPPASEAIVAVSTSPEEADLVVDGQRAGSSPAVFEVAPGVHRLEARASGHRAAQREVRVKAGARLAVHLALPSLQPEPEPPSGDSAASPEPEQTPPIAQTTPRRTTTGTGMLNVSSVPWARVSVDGRSTGLTTPARGIRLAAGTHSVELSNTVTGVRKRFTVRIEPGRTATLRVRLAP